MTAFSNYTENQILAHIFRSGSFTKPSALYVGLITAVSSGETGSVTEVSGGSYARTACNPSDSNWSAASNNGTTSNAVAITFPAATADWGTITYFGIWDASTSGNLILYAPMTVPRNITTGSTPSFAIGALTVQIDN
ncbi:MAG: phage tail fiber protein [Methylobacter sp.]